MGKQYVSPAEDGYTEGYGMECEQAYKFFSVTQSF